MSRLLRLLGSLRIAVPLLIAIAAVLSWGTIYEARFGTAAVQRVVYQAWWFHLLLGFLAVNLAAAAIERYPWQRRHTPFLCAHLGIILILIGGILGGRFGVEGQLIIPEGQAERVLQLSQNVLRLQPAGSEAGLVIPTAFESRAWVHEPHRHWTVPLGARTIHLTVDRYYPDAQVAEEIIADDRADQPAVELRLAHEGQEDDVWLLANDPERYGVRWGLAHVLFLEPRTPEQLAQVLGREVPAASRGTVLIQLPQRAQPAEIPVPDALGEPIAIEGTPYTVTFKDYFPDFAVTAEGVTSRSSAPNNPAVAFVLSGPEGPDAHLAFSRHPEFAQLHGQQHRIAAQVRYAHPADAVLPPDAIGIVRLPAGALAAVLTAAGQPPQRIEPMEVGAAYTHPSLGYQFTVRTYHPRARRTPHVTNRSNDVRTPALHVVARDGAQTAETWVGLREAVELPLGRDPIMVEYRPAERALPVTIKLVDFRKIDYPGTQMAAGFESDVELSDPTHGVILIRTIRMNHPLRYRGYSFYQSSYIPGPTETTVLAVRSDPGTPLVYAGFLIVMAGVVGMFLLRRPPERAA